MITVEVRVVDSETGYRARRAVALNGPGLEILPGEREGLGDALSEGLTQCERSIRRALARAQADGQ